jgi:hypothetical protein
MKKTRRVTDEVSEQIWKYIWNNSNSKDTDENLLQEHTDYCKEYIKGTYLKFIK